MPLLLDLFCCAGGAAMGYRRAGFDVIGVDIDPQPNYPFEFVQADAMTHDLSGFDAVHASPPCQGYVQLSEKHRGNGTVADTHDRLIQALRKRLQSAGVPYVIENVYGARRDMPEAFILTGEMFGLGTHRPRLFDCSFDVDVPTRPPCNPNQVPVYGKLDGRRLWTRKDGSELRAPSELETPSRAMGIDWMTWEELREAIPPAYTEFIGRQLMEHLRVVSP